MVAAVLDNGAPETRSFLCSVPPPPGPAGVTPHGASVSPSLACFSRSPTLTLEVGMCTGVWLRDLGVGSQKCLNLGGDGVSPRTEVGILVLKPSQE